MRYRLRTLCVLLAVCPPVLAYAWSLEQQYRQWLVQQAELQTQPFTISWESAGPVADLDLAFEQGGPVPER